MGDTVRGMQCPHRDAPVIAPTTRRDGSCAPAAWCPSTAVARNRKVVLPPPCVRAIAAPLPAQPMRSTTTVADKSPRQHQSKKSGKSLKEKRTEKKGKQVTKRLGS